MKKILFVSSAGGHFSELKKIKLNFECEKIIVTEKVSQTVNEEIDYYLKYGTREEKLKYIPTFISNAIKAFKIIQKEKPDIIISTGAHTCVPFFYIGKFFKTKNIYIESYAKVSSPSLTYKISKFVIDKVIVQHEEMLQVYDKAIFLGSIY